MKAPKEMLLRHWQNVVRGLNTLDHVLRRQEPSDVARAQLDSAHSVPESQQVSSFVSLSRVVVIGLICGPVYGCVMGSYAFIAGHRTWVEQVPQMLYSGIKVPLLIAVTVIISLPSFFVISSLLGLRNDFRESLRSIVSAQAGLTVILASLFPLTLFCYVSMSAAGASYSLAVLFNAAMFGLASISAQVLLRGYYRPLIARNPRHRWMVRMWIFVFAFVGIQAAYVLRPFIGDPGTPTTFLRHESFENAYVKVIGMLSDVIFGFFGGS